MLETNLDLNYQFFHEHYVKKTVPCRLNLGDRLPSMDALIVPLKLYNTKINISPNTFCKTRHQSKMKSITVSSLNCYYCLIPFNNYV